MNNGLREACPGGGEPVRMLPSSPVRTVRYHPGIASVFYSRTGWAINMFDLSVRAMRR